MLTQTDASGSEPAVPTIFKGHPPRAGAFLGLPSPAELSEYERLVPGTTAEFMKLLEREQSLRAEVRQSKLRLVAQSDQVGQRYALIVWLTGIATVLAVGIVALAATRGLNDMGRPRTELLVMIVVQLVVTFLGSRAFLAKRRDEALK